jgi:hypothetical protein
MLLSRKNGKSPSLSAGFTGDIEPAAPRVLGNGYGCAPKRIQMHSFPQPFLRDFA